MEAETNGAGTHTGTQGPKRGRKPSEVRKVALNLRLDPEIHRQLKVHALLSNSTASDIVAELVRAHLKVYTVNGPEAEGPAHHPGP